MSLFRKRQHDTSEAAVEEAVSAGDYDAQADLALPHTGHEEEIDAGIGMLGSSLVPPSDAAGYDAERDVGFAP